MFIRVIKDKPYVWWNGRIGEVFEVHDAPLSHSSLETHYELVARVPDCPHAFAITKTDCEIIVRNPSNNKDAIYLLNKED